MSQHVANDINRLIGEFTDLQERWETEHDAFDWSALQTLARNSAQAYNEGAGPSFHMLALDGVEHNEFHERFLAYSLDAGFDPFKLAKTGSGNMVIPVIGHSGLLEAARWNSSSARMRASLMEYARAKFTLPVQKAENETITPDDELYRIFEACAESIPLDLLGKVVPELAKSHAQTRAAHPGNPVEGLLSTAEMIVDNNSKPYG
jgi:hypothetical protein